MIELSIRTKDDPDYWTVKIDRYTSKFWPFVAGMAAIQKYGENAKPAHFLDFRRSNSNKSFLSGLSGHGNFADVGLDDFTWNDRRNPELVQRWKPASDRLWLNNCRCQHSHLPSDSAHP